MSRIRVLVSAPSRVISGALADAIAAQPDMEVVGQALSSEDLTRTVARIGPDILVLDHRKIPAPVDWASTPYSDRPLKVLAIVGEDGHGLIYELRPCRALLGEMSPPSLVEAIRSASTAEA
ncbi:hypothetical protein [Phenylobacterium immobile]|uniref:hypothetical protein n=1 Tax=Phenylobacterium immobile TaxID=21 RepID=UPI000AE3857A|nr:hypothetical protein [Phenylobacterium immobile]